MLQTQNRLNAVRIPASCTTQKNYGNMGLASPVNAKKTPARNGSVKKNWPIRHAVHVLPRH